MTADSQAGRIVRRHNLTCGHRVHHHPDVLSLPWVKIHVLLCPIAFSLCCLTMLTTGWQDSCLCASSWSLCDPQGCMCAFGIDQAWKINVTRLVWLSILPPSFCSLWSWHRWIITTEFGLALITGVSTKGGGLRHHVKRKTWHTHLLKKNRVVWHKCTKCVM